MTELDMELQELRRYNAKLLRAIEKNEETIKWLEGKLQQAEEKIRKQDWLLTAAKEGRAML